MEYNTVEENENRWNGVDYLIRKMCLYHIDQLQICTFCIENPNHFGFFLEAQSTISECHSVGYICFGLPRHFWINWDWIPFSVNSICLQFWSGCQMTIVKIRSVYLCDVVRRCVCFSIPLRVNAPCISSNECRSQIHSNWTETWKSWKPEGGACVESIWFHCSS